MKHLSKFDSFNEGRVSKAIGAAGLALAAASGTAKEKSKEKNPTEYVVPDGRKDIIESYHSLLKKEGIRFKKAPKFSNLDDVKDYIKYLDDLCEKNDIGLHIKSKKN